MLTTEQQAVVDHIINLTPADPSLVLINAIAGSGKTFLLTSIANAVPHTNGLYLAYNKSIATEASHKFPKTTACLTTHSLAYRAIVPVYKLKVGTFSYRSITDAMPYENKLLVIDFIREFCLSSYLAFEDFAEANDIVPHTSALCLKYLNRMATGTIECSHDLYLKLFHIALSNGTATYPEFDFLMLDESGDLNEVTLEIFRLLPAKFKIAVGDKQQNIYGFNHTINAFDLLSSEGTTFNMTQSFRVSASIANDIESFCNKFIDPDMNFDGVPNPSTKITTRAHISRTNASLIKRIIELSRSNTPYSLIRKATEIFRLPLAVCSFKHNGTVSDPAYTHLQGDINDWFETVRLEVNPPALFAYLSQLHDHDAALKGAMHLVLNFGKSAIMEAFEDARSHEKTKTNLTLLTAHSSKGLEFDEVFIADDLNDAVAAVVESNNFTSEENLAELRLYYVACSRARVALHNAYSLHLELPNEPLNPRSF